MIESPIPRRRDTVVQLRSPGSIGEESLTGVLRAGARQLLPRAIAEGYRESARSWRELPLDLERRGLSIGPEWATGNGALRFSKALREVYGQAREQRC